MDRAEKETLHSYRFAMLGKLLQDGVSCFQAELVLLGFVLLDKSLEEASLLGGERRALWRHIGEASVGVGGEMSTRMASQTERLLSCLF